MVPTSSKNDLRSKSSIRAETLNARQSLSAGEAELRTQRIFRIFSDRLDDLAPPAGSFETVALYFPIRGEVDTRSFFKFFRSRRKRCLFPRVEKTAAGPRLAFYEIQDWSELQLGAFGIGEPAPVPGASTLEPDLVLVPGIAFSDRLYRIGFGAGHYDRAVERWIQANRRQAMRLVGLAFDFQIVNDFSHESHDHPMDAVVTESRVLQRSPT